MGGWGVSHESGSWEAKADKIFARLINNRWMEPNGLHAPQKTWVLNIPFNGESQIQSPRTNTGLGAGSSPQGPGLCPVMRGCLPRTLCVLPLPLREANRLYSDSLLQKAVKVFGSALRAFSVHCGWDRKCLHKHCQPFNNTKGKTDTERDERRRKKTKRWK